MNLPNRSLTTNTCFSMTFSFTRLFWLIDGRVWQAKQKGRKRIAKRPTPYKNPSNLAQDMPRNRLYNAVSHSRTMMLITYELVSWQSDKKHGETLCPIKYNVTTVWQVEQLGHPHPSKPPPVTIINRQHAQLQLKSVWNLSVQVSRIYLSVQNSALFNVCQYRPIRMLGGRYE